MKRGFAKRIISILASVCLVTCLAPVATANANASDTPEYYPTSSDDVIYVAAGGTISVDAYGLSNLSEIASVSIDNESIATASLWDWETVSVSGQKAGTATLTLTFEGWDDETEMVALGICVINVPNSLSVTTYTVSEYDTQEVRVPVAGLMPCAQVSLTCMSDAGSYDTSCIVGNGCFELEIYYPGTYRYTANVAGKVIPLTIVSKLISLSKTNVVSYKGLKTQLKVKGISSSVTWRSTDKKVAIVNSSGVVKGKKIGRCYVKATVAGHTVTCLVEVTYKKAYKAVKNAFKDMRTKLAYSQSMRMGKKYRDCSSFVSRCYWDSSLGRRIYAIGGSGGKAWAYNASAQAKWLNSKGKRVAYKAVSASKLLPGDLIYYQTNYAGVNNEYRHIDHVGIYVGGGMVLNTGGWGGKGTIGYRGWGYYKGDASVKFIGRPCK